MTNATDRDALQRSLDEALGRPAEGQFVRMHIHASPVNEEYYQETILKNLPAIPCGKRPLHIGVAGFFNLEMLARGGYDTGLLIDFNEYQELWWRDVIGLLCECETPEAFSKTYYYRHVVRTGGGSHELLDWPEATHFRLSSGEKIYVEGGSDLPNTEFLKNQEAYSRVRQMALDGKLLTQTVNLVTDAERVDKLRQWIDGRGFDVRTIYASNLYNPGGRFSASAGKYKPGDSPKITDGEAKLLHNLGNLANNAESRIFMTHAGGSNEKPLITIAGPATAHLIAERMPTLDLENFYRPRN